MLTTLLTSRGCWAHPCWAGPQAERGDKTAGNPRTKTKTDRDRQETKTQSNRSNQARQNDQKNKKNRADITGRQATSRNNSQSSRTGKSRES